MVSQYGSIFFKLLKMKKHLVFALSCLLAFFQADALFSQQIKFSEVFHDNINGENFGNSIIATNDQSYMVVGQTGNYKGLLLKIDSLGAIVWSKKIETTANGGTVFSCIKPTYDSCFVVVGHTDGIANKGAICMKFNSEGDTLWTKAFGINGYEYALHVEQTSDSGYIITGFSDFNYNLFVAKLNFNGALEWMNNIIISNNKTIGNSVKQTQDGGYVVCGSTENYPAYESNFFILKLNSNGSVSWTKLFKTPQNSQISGNDIMVLHDGFLCVFISGYNSELVKTDTSGNLIWSKKIGNGFNMQIYFTTPKIHKTHDNCFVFTDGSCNGAKLIKIDTSGNLLLSKGLDLASNELIETPDKGFMVVGGQPCVEKDPYQDIQIGIIKTDSLGNADCTFNHPDTNITADTLICSIKTASSTFTGSLSNVHPIVSPTALVAYDGCVSGGGGIPENNLSDKLSIFPVPAKEIISVSLNSSGAEGIITIYNLMGQSVIKQSLIKNNTLIDISSLTKGIYLIKVYNEDGFGVKKFVKD